MERPLSAPAQTSRPVPRPRTGDSRGRLLDAALRVFREQGYTATTVDDLCAAAGVTKGSFFHHFDSKEAATLAAIAHWNTVTGEAFAAAPYWQITDPRERLLGYLDFRARLVDGPLGAFTCLLGTLVQETYASHPAIRAACGAGIEAHGRTLVPTIEAARGRHAPEADWTAESLARHLQASLQGGFVLAKAQADPAATLDTLAHLRRYVERLLPLEAAPCAASVPPAVRGPHPRTRRRS